MTFKFTGINIGKRPTISVLFEVGAYKISRIVNFLVDTGSLFSGITEKEATLMGLECSLLPESKREAVGFGGIFRTKMINRLVTLTFQSSEGEHKIKHSSGFRVICIPSNVTRETREKLIRYTPSVLGMDILSKFDVFVGKKKVELTVIP